MYFYGPFQSGSQNDLCDSWEKDDVDPSSTTGTGTPNSSNVRSQGGFTPTSRTVSAEYPFHANLCLQPSQSINFDLTHKRGNQAADSFFKEPLTNTPQRNGPTKLFTVCTMLIFSPYIHWYFSLQQQPN